MRKKRIFWLIRLLALALCVFCTATIVSAHSIANLNTDLATGWNKIDSRHMGSRGTSYAYESAALKNRFHTFVEAGINMWGVSIHCVESTTNPKGTIVASDYWGNATASVSSDFNSTGHVTGWEMEIYVDIIREDLYPEEVKRTFAHEIGHVYGLDHVNTSSQIMYGQASSTKSVTTADMRGMLLMTHQHLHDESTNYDINSDTYTHNLRCRTCLAYETIECFTSEWHSGNRHYFVNNCECGNTGTVSVVCNAADCPYS